jgi:hypothetical protein
MPELNFKGKEFVFNHHLAVPHRPLVPDASKSIGEPRLDGSLIIHGDNLHALKSLPPMYAGEVDCIFISVLRLMTDAFAVESVGELELVVEDGAAVECDLVLMPEWKTRLPTMVQS